MILSPRQYQIDAVRSVYEYFNENTGNPILALPTGTGKSVIIAMFLESMYAYYPTQRVMVLTHVKELIQQNYEKLVTMWPAAPAGIYSAGLNRKEVGRKITFAGIASVAKQAQLFGHMDLVIIDEAHLVSPSDNTMYRAFLDALAAINPALKVIGLTATPWRLGMGQITDGGIFTDVCYDITSMTEFNKLIAAGFLAPLVPKQTALMLDLEGVHLTGGEFNQGQLQSAIDRDEVTNVALHELLEQAADRNHWLIFASGVEHATHIAEALTAMGVPSIAIHSKMADGDRDRAIADFKAGKYRAAVNNNVLTTGFDFPAIDCIAVLRPTMSTVLWVQMLGRGTRPSPATGKKNCLVLDFAGNTRRLGPINDPVVPKKRGKKAGEAPVKLCGNCATYNHASVAHCIHCGAEFSFQVKIKQTASSDELLKNDEPQVETFAVTEISYSRHDKQDKPTTLKVTYYCGLRAFSEYICIEHTGFVQRKARRWWRERTEEAFPESVAAALLFTGKLKPTTHLRVWVNKQYPEILAHCLDGSGFNSST